jgi:hypothetical protein
VLTEKLRTESRRDSALPRRPRTPASRHALHATTRCVWTLPRHRPAANWRPAFTDAAERCPLAAGGHRHLALLPLPASQPPRLRREAASPPGSSTASTPRSNTPPYAGITTRHLDLRQRGPRATPLSPRPDPLGAMPSDFRRKLDVPAQADGTANRATPRRWIARADSRAVARSARYDSGCVWHRARSSWLAGSVWVRLGCANILA